MPLMIFCVDRPTILVSKIHHTGKNYYEYMSEPYTKPVVAEEVIKVISKFQSNKSPGPDDIGNLVVKRIAPEISEPLTTVFNCSFSTGVFPDQLKIAKVIPKYKKDNADVFSNYRPVSVLPCFSKNT